MVCDTVCRGEHLRKTRQGHRRDSTWRRDGQLIQDQEVFTGVLGIGQRGIAWVDGKTTAEDRVSRSEGHTDRDGLGG